MRTYVCIKQTPDSASVSIDPRSQRVDTDRFVPILNPADACALEAAARLKEQLGGTITALTCGPADAEGTLRAALALGADHAVRLWKPQASEWGAMSIASALAAYLRQAQPTPDLILCGNASSDWASGVIGPAIAAYLSLPQITGVSQLSIEQERGQPTLHLTRKLERGYREQLAAEPPLLLTVTSDLNEPRYPSLPAHLASLQTSIPVLEPSTGDNLTEGEDETMLLELHLPRPRPHRLAAPNSQHSAYQRIGEIISGGTASRQTRLVEGSSEELARTLLDFLKEKGFL